MVLFNLHPKPLRIICNIAVPLPLWNVMDLKRFLLPFPCSLIHIDRYVHFFRISAQVIRKPDFLKRIVRAPLQNRFRKFFQIKYIQFIGYNGNLLPAHCNSNGNGVADQKYCHAQKNQKLIITILDEFIDETLTKEVEKTARGILGKYANPELQKLEKSAWEKAVVTRYGDA